MKKQVVQKSNQNQKQQQKQQEDDDDSFNHDPNRYDRIQQSFENSMKLSVKDHIEKIEDELRSQNKYLETSKKDIQNVKLDFNTLSDRAQQILQDQVQTGILNEAQRVNKEYKRIGKTADDELNFLIQNMLMVQNNQSELNKLIEHLEQRVRKVEDDVGFKFIFDGMEKQQILQQQQMQDESYT